MSGSRTAVPALRRTYISLKDTGARLHFGIRVIDVRTGLDVKRSGTVLESTLQKTRRLARRGGR